MKQVFGNPAPFPVRPHARIYPGAFLITQAAAQPPACGRPFPLGT